MSFKETYVKYQNVIFLLSAILLIIAYIPTMLIITNSFIEYVYVVGGLGAGATPAVFLFLLFLSPIYPAVASIIYYIKRHRSQKFLLILNIIIIIMLLLFSSLLYGFLGEFAVLRPATGS